ncbi:MAG: hypothetical protein ABSD75_25750 [Terriglobales bacterium]|jgi:hypothetical protein
MDLIRERLIGESDPEQRVRAFIFAHLEYFLANSKSMKMLSHEDDVLKEELGTDIANLKRQYYRCCADLVDALKTVKGLQFNSRVAVLSLFGMMNWIYTWHNPHVDGDAKVLARENRRCVPAWDLRYLGSPASRCPAAEGASKFEALTTSLKAMS